MNEKKYLSLELEHVGVLSGLLKNMTGNATLIHELIQNADDAKAEVMWFRLSEDSMIVDNDRLFSDCGQDQGPCPWTPICDFHGFRKPASQRKRFGGEGIGAFGIGFTAVLGVSDHPELISNNRHWIRFDEREDGSKRIEQCAGCASCTGDLPPTRFILPWAFDNSILRQGLKLEPVSRQRPREILGDLIQLLPHSLLFLNHVRTVRVYWNGSLEVQVAHEVDSGTIVVNEEAQKWHVIRSSFDNEARKLKEWHPHIDPKQRSQVAIAIRKGWLESGVFCAYLPTELETGLPLHFNADFFPTNDRKDILFTDDYQGAWNRAALRNGSEKLACSLLGIRDFLGPEELWKFFDRVCDSCPTSEHFKGIWQRLSEWLRSGSYFWTSKSRWVTRHDVVYEKVPGKCDLSELHEQLGIQTLHSCVASSKHIRKFLDPLGASHIRRGLQSISITGEIPCSKLPAWFQSEKNWSLLLDQVRVILEMSSSARDELCLLSIAKCIDDVVRPCNDVFVADSDTAALFSRLECSPNFLVHDEEHRAVLGTLCREFSTADAIQYCFRSAERVPGSLELLAEDLRRWFGTQYESMSPEDLQELRRLPICPTNRGLKPFADALVADESTINLFCPLDKSLRGWISKELVKPFTKLCGQMTAQIATEILEEAHLGLDNHTALSLLTYLADNVPTPTGNIQGRLAKLPLCPTSVGPRSANSGVAVSGREFSDPIGVARLVDLGAVSESQRQRVQHFLTSVLGVPTLTFHQYVCEQLPAYFETHSPEIEKCTALVEFLARDKLGPLLEDTSLQESLRNLRIVTTVGGEITTAKDTVYIDNPEVRRLFDEDAVFVKPQSNSVAVNEFYRKVLQIPDRPVLNHVIELVQRVACKPLSDQAINKLKAICEHLSQRLAELRNEHHCITVLKSANWLPSFTFEHGERVFATEWLPPDSLHHDTVTDLCASVGRFSSIKLRKEFAELIGVRMVPTMNEVVEHLDNLIKDRLEIPRKLYEWLGSRTPEVPERLRDTNCICVTIEGSLRFVRPDECTFSRDHPFGPYRIALDDTWKACAELLSKLGVKSDHSWEDAIAILRTASAHPNFSKSGILALEERNALLQCWGMLNKELEVGNQKVLEKIKSCFGSA